jgi:hypothetical protein
MLKHAIKYIPIQKNTGPWIGALKDLFSRATFYISIINFFLLIATAYYTTLRNFIPVPFVWFMGFTVLIIILAMSLEYIIIMPSCYVFSNMQTYKHDNPLKDDIKLIIEQLDTIEEKINGK